jgi:hypothetical protein
VSMLRTAGEVPVEEDDVTLPGQRMDIALHSLTQDSRNRALDASVVDPTRPGGRTIAQREQDKTVSLAPRWSRIGFDLIPCVVNVFGGLGTRLSEYIQSLSAHVEIRTGVAGAIFRRYWMRTLAITAVVASTRELWSAMEGIRRARTECIIENRSSRMSFLSYAAMMVDYSGIW